MIGENVLALMHEKGLTQSELANRAHISQSTLSAIINGDSKPKQSTIAELASALEVQICDLTKSAELPTTLKCPVCGSASVVEWTHHKTGACRLRCDFCGADSGDQQSRAKAITVFQSFHSADQNSQSAELNPRVLSLSELLDTSAYDDSFVRVAWLENRGLFVVPSLIECDIAEREGEYIRAEWHGSHGSTTFMMNQYNSWWRCWSEKPTDAQVENTPWN